MRRLPLADRLRVRTPCEAPVTYAEMAGGDRSRFCASCKHDVHDVSTLTREEVEALLRSRKGGEHLCLHLHVRRSDGAVLLADGYALPAANLVRRKLADALVTMSAAALGAASLTACASPPVAQAPSAEVAVAPSPPAPSPPAPSPPSPSPPSPSPPAPSAPEARLVAPPPTAQAKPTKPTKPSKTSKPTTKTTHAPPTPAKSIFGKTPLEGHELVTGLMESSTGDTL